MYFRGTALEVPARPRTLPVWRRAPGLAIQTGEPECQVGAEVTSVEESPEENMQNGQSEGRVLGDTTSERQKGDEKSVGKTGEKSSLQDEKDCHRNQAGVPLPEGCAPTPLLFSNFRALGGPYQRGSSGVKVSSGQTEQRAASDRTVSLFLLKKPG